MPGTINGTRVIALVGPAGAGKTTLAEAMLFAAGAIDRQGSTANGSTVGDFSPEARARGGSTEINAMNFDYKGEHYALLDSPGSIGFAADGARGVAVADLAIVVVDPDPARAALAAPSLRMLDELGVPHETTLEIVKAWPVPAQEHLTLEGLPASLACTLEVNDSVGRIIPVRSVRNGSRMTVDVAPLPSGL